jgi:hypothetical protein
VPEAEYEALKRKATEPSEEREQTLREDYEIALYRDQFYIDYCCSCQKCGFEFSYKREIKLKEVLKGGKQ